MKRERISAKISNGCSFPIISLASRLSFDGAKIANAYIRKERVVEFVRNNKDSYISTIAESIDEPIPFVIQTISELKKIGKAKVE